MVVGMAHDYPASWNPYFSNHPFAVPAAMDIHCHQVVGKERPRRRGRCVAVCFACHSACCHYRHRQYHRCIYRHCLGWSWSRAVVLAHGCFWHRYQVCRGTACHQVSCHHIEGTYVGRSYVCFGARFGLAHHGGALCLVHSHRLFWHWQHGTGKCHCHAGL